MKKKTKRTMKKQPKTRYSVNRKPQSELDKFGQWVSGGVHIEDGGDFNDMILGFMWQAWQAALPKVRK